ncbi:MAG: hypothetical protein APF76_08565 [Desulfitibacter sp. BRH_c19]|nr:MAG: hypothetical protein APF76_08565 [Desulfitibacter sp. BRH_c19]
MLTIKGYSVNKQAVKIIKEKIVPFSEELGVGIIKLACGATVVDMGINHPGGWMAAKLFTEIGLGGLGQCSFGKMYLDKYSVPTCVIHVAEPAIAEMASHVAYWRIVHKNKNITISGPIRAINGSDSFAKSVDYRDILAHEAVAMIQTTDIPDDDLAQYIAHTVDLKPVNLYIVVAPTAGIVGAIQVCARNVEQSLPSIFDRGFSMDKIVHAEGVSPIVSIVDDEMLAWGRVNDCLIYGQESNIYVRCKDEEIESILEDLPFSKNKDVFGTPFMTLFNLCENDWTKVPRNWDAPCKVNFYNVSTGNSYSTGIINYQLLKENLLG